MLRHRLVTGTLLIALLVAVVWIDAQPFANGLDGASWIDLVGSGGTPPRGLVLLGFTVLVVASLLGAEIGRLLRQCGLAVPTALTAIGVPVVALSTAVAATLPAGALAAMLAPLSLLAIAGVSLLFAAAPERHREALAAAAACGLACGYAGASLGGWIVLRFDHSAWILGGAVLTAKSCDIGAYFTGRAIGSRKLIPWLSPGKTWEGLLGGVAIAALVGGLLALASSHLPAESDHLSPLVGTVLGAVLGLLGQAGDLAESLLKRAAGAKDSGRTLPGMGGVFDVMDSLLPAGLLLPLVLGSGSG